MHKSNQYSYRRELSIFDLDNRRSLVRVLPEPVVLRLKAAWESEDGPLFGLTERGLRDELIRRGKIPTVGDSRIRAQFWFEYDHMINLHTSVEPYMDMSRVLGAAISKEAFYKYWLPDNTKLAWMICPPSGYVMNLEEAVNASHDLLRDCLTALAVKQQAGLMNGALIKEITRIDAIFYSRMAALLPRVPVKAPVEKTKKEKVAAPVEAVPAVDRSAEREERRLRIEAMNKKVADSEPKPPTPETPT